MLSVWHGRSRENSAIRALGLLDRYIFTAGANAIVTVHKLQVVFVSTLAAIILSLTSNRMKAVLLSSSVPLSSNVFSLNWTLEFFLSVFSAQDLTLLSYAVTQ
jgi:hypothetical protein